jgi:O-antigen ligase
MTRSTHADSPTRLIRWLFYAFVFLLPYETAGEGWLEPTTILGALLLLSTLLQPGLFLRWPSKGYWCFFIYLYIFAALSATEPSALRSLTVLNVFLLTQLTILGWIALSVMRDEKVAERALVSFAAGCALLALLQLTGIAGRPVDDQAVIIRITAFGFHPNNLARILMLGLLALIGLTFGRPQSLFRPSIICLPFIALIVAALLQTGSRGALLALTSGLMTLILRKGDAWVKVRNACGLLVLLGLFVFAVSQSDIMSARFENTIEQGDVARRDLIYPAAWQMFLEKPLLGWGPINSTFELGTRLGHLDEETKNPHNLILFGLVSTGLIGAMPLFVGIGLASHKAWKSRHGVQGILPLAMIVAVFVANMSGLWLFNKLHWLVMAYALASVYHEAGETASDTDVADVIESRTYAII